MPFGEHHVELVRRALVNSLAQQRVRLFFWLTLLHDNPALARVRDTDVDALATRILSEEGAYFLSHHLPEDIDSTSSPYWAAPIGAFTPTTTSALAPMRRSG